MIKKLMCIYMYDVVHVLSLVPRLPSVFNNAHRKAREPAKIHHVHDVEGGRDLAQRAHHLCLTKLSFHHDSLSNLKV